MGSRYKSGEAGKPAVTKPCLMGGKGFICKAGAVSWRKYCSRACKGAAKTAKFAQPFVCATCGKTGVRVPSKLGKYCSKECFGAGYSKEKIAEDNWYVKSDGYLAQSRNRKTGLQHRKVMEEMLGRPLKSHEDVHHKDGVRANNAPKNLELWSRSQPRGQRVEDKIAFCKYFLAEYQPSPEYIPSDDRGRCLADNLGVY